MTNIRADILERVRKTIATPISDGLSDPLSDKVWWTMGREVYEAVDVVVRDPVDNEIRQAIIRVCDV